MNNNTLNIDMNALANIVSQMINTGAITTEQTATTTTNSNRDWAKTSQFHGKELCGYAYNPYLVRRFVPAQFDKLTKEFNYDIHTAVRKSYGIEWSIKYLIEECRKLSMLNKYDKIAYAERSCFWTIANCKEIFEDYCIKAIEYVDYLVGNSYNERVYIPGRGYAKVKTTEVIENHRVLVKKTLVNSPIKMELRQLKNDIKRCYSYKDLYNVMHKHTMIKLPSKYKVNYVYNSTTRRCDTKKYVKNVNGFDLSTTFIDGFKKTGAYYTIKNDIMFMNATFENATGREAIALLNSHLGDKPYVMYAIYKKYKEVN